MKLYLTRHGEALESHEDPKRPLSSLGRQQITKLGIFLKEAHVEIESIYHSGKARAEETAMILYDFLPTKQKPKAITGLLPDDPLEILADSLEHFNTNTLLVGHLPYMAELASYLLTGKTNIHLLFNTGTTLCLEPTHPGAWGLSWMIDPRLFK